MGGQGLGGGLSVDSTLAALRRRRTTVLLLSLVYFVVLLALGVLFFLRGMGGVAAYVLAALCAAGYLLLVRPMRGRYTAAVREAVIRYTVCGGIEDLSYAPKGGIPTLYVRDVGLFEGIRPGAFMSREYVSGRSGPIRVEAADVTFPIVEEGRNAMFSGLLMDLTWPGASLPPAEIRGGDTGGVRLPGHQLAMVEALGELIPGSLYLRSSGERLTVLLRGRFLGIPINPLLPPDSRLLKTNPLPELDQAVRLVRLMGGDGKKQKGEDRS